jgi:hypothetical protein
MSLRDHLQEIYDHHGQLTPDLVVEVARPKDHPLHSRVFDRPQKQAAEAWYKHRAHELIQSVKVVYRDSNDEPQEIRKYHAVRGDSGVVYRASEDIADDPFAKKLVLRDMEREWHQLRARYERFSEFFEMVEQDIELMAAA